MGLRRQILELDEGKKCAVFGVLPLANINLKRSFTGVIDDVKLKD